VPKLIILKLFILVINVQFSYCQNNFEILIPWGDTCASSLDIVENEDHSSIILSNNYYFNEDTFIYIEGVPTYGSGITTISPEGNILSREMYYTNGSGSWSMFTTGRIPASSIWFENHKLIIPYSQYIGLSPCDSINSISSARSYKIGTIEIGGTSNGYYNNKLFIDDSLCSVTNYMGFGIINDSCYIALENDERENNLFVTIRRNTGEIISRNQIDDRFLLLLGNARFGTFYKNKVIYQNTDTTFTTLFYDRIGMKRVMAKAYPNGTINILFTPTIPDSYENIVVKKSHDSFYCLFNEIDTSSSSLTYIGTHLYKYNQYGTTLDILNLPDIIAKGIEINDDQNILLLLDKTSNIVQPNIGLPIRVCLIDSFLDVKSYRDFGFSNVRPVAISSDNNITILGTKLADISITPGIPSQIYVCRTDVDNINVPYTKSIAPNLFSIFPIPSYKFFYIKSNNEHFASAKAGVIDILGRLVTTIVIDDQVETFSTDKWDMAGIYFVDIYTETEYIERHKIVVIE
jgi:hypothetical protein